MCIQACIVPAFQLTTNCLYFSSIIHNFSNILMAYFCVNISVFTLYIMDGLFYSAYSPTTHHEAEERDSRGGQCCYDLM